MDMQVSEIKHNAPFHPLFIHVNTSAFIVLLNSLFCSSFVFLTYILCFLHL